ncbi:hypothetical protein EJ08DRAFT_701310 [Tothia fuscella]|uniref:Fungal STAND N-terminal Goodbye domain-containing protein n=1 Tax=Tothia fuscella TaxID=1048955 RepID=A0A9P4NIX9_9PEZI|nr:hypothetical protein EJ08DRAFT_701310 [Tothia fuscella]
MATTAGPTMNGGKRETESDLAQLWQEAVEEYEKKTKTSLRMSPFKSLEDVMRGTEGMQNKFKDFRNDQGKVDKVRTAFKNNLWLIQKVVNTVQMVGNAASAFPPAMPASLIFSAFGQVMQTFGQMSADYDKVMGFFDFTTRFLDRLSIIQDKTPDLPQFKRCVVRVFSSMLVICSVAQNISRKSE